MDKMEIFNFLLYTKNNYFKTESGFEKAFPDIYNDLNKISFPNNFTFIQKIWHYLQNDLKLNLGKCGHCSNISHFNGFNDGYNPFCSKKCANSSETHHKQYKETCLKKYRVDNASKSKSIKKQKQKTVMSHYGVDNPSKCKNIQEKKKTTCLAKYGTEFYQQSDSCKKRIQKTWEGKSQEETDNIVNRRKETCVRLYGCSSPIQNNDIKEKIKNT